MAGFFRHREGHSFERGMCMGDVLTRSEVVGLLKTRLAVYEAQMMQRGSDKVRLGYAVDELIALVLLFNGDDENLSHPLSACARTLEGCL
jgi:hypothetical protein